MEENIQVNPEDQKVLEAIETEFEMSTRIYDCLNIAIVGRTGTGKSSFINAFRKVLNNQQNAAKEGANTKETEIKIKEAKLEHNVTVNNMEVTINFFDTKGFMDNNNTDVEVFLQELKKEKDFKIDEFDAIIFLTQGRLSDQELKIAKQNEKKSVMLFFVYNQVDNLFRNVLKINCLNDDDVPFTQQIQVNKQLLETELKKVQQEISELIKTHDVFDCLLSDIEKFSSDDLKNQSYKDALIDKSIYFITSTVKHFEDELLAKDGKRLRKEIEHHLVLTKFNNMNIDLFDPFSERTIYFKKKTILNNLFYGKKLKIAGAAFTSIIPFLEILPTTRIKKSFKEEFFEKFGMKELKEKIQNEPNLVSSDSNKIQKIKLIFDNIEQDKTIQNLDSLVDSSSITDFSSLKEKIKRCLNSILPAIGIGSASLVDDFMTKIGGIALTFTKKSLIALSLISIPVSISLYLFLLRKGVEQILIKYEEYALLIMKVLHN